MKKLQLKTWLFLFLFSILSAGLVAEGLFEVKGTITSPTGKAVPSKEVELVEITMSNPPKLTTVTRSKTDQNGRYLLKLPTDKQASGMVFYRVSILVNGQAFGSNPFRFKTGSAMQPIDLVIPAQLSGARSSLFKKELLFVESINETLLVTNFLFLSGLPGRVIEVTKQFPVEATTFHLLSTNVAKEISREKNQMEVEFSPNAESQELIFRYEIPLTAFGAKFGHYPTEGIQELEVTTTNGDLVIELDRSLEEYGTISGHNRQMAGKTFISRFLSFERHVPKAFITIGTAPPHQRNFIAPAIVLFILLIAGMAIYLLKVRSIKPVS